MNRQIFSLFVLFALTTFTARAQQQEPVVKTELLTIALEEPIEELFFTNAGGEIISISANLTGLGQPIPYKGPQRLVFRATKEEFGREPPLPAPVAVVNLPLKADRVLLTCLKSGAAPLRIVPYDISAADLRAGDYRVFNFSSHQVSISFGGGRFLLAAGNDKSVSKPSWRDDVLDLPMQVAIVQDNQPRLVYSSVWGHRPGRRSFVFMFNGRHPSTPVGINRFFDFPTASQPAQ